MQPVARTVTLRPAFHSMRAWGSVALLIALLKFGIEHPPRALYDNATSLVVEPLLQRFDRAATGEIASLEGLIVLGGGEERLREAGQLARRWKHLKVFVSGAGEPEYVRRALGAGIEDVRLSIETQARNTYENAFVSARALSPDDRQRWLLVTSAIHMPRAIGAFRRSNFDVLPWPVHDLRLNDHGTMRAAMHEWVGLLGYWMLGRMSDFFPGPRMASAGR